MSRYGYHVMVVAVLLAFAFGAVAGVLLVRTGHDPTAKICRSTTAGLVCTL